MQRLVAGFAATSRQCVLRDPKHLVPARSNPSATVVYLQRLMTMSHRKNVTATAA